MSTSSISSNITRLSGLSSTLDTESIVEAMLLTSQAKVDRQNQYTTKLEWKADALREINSLIKTFRQDNMSVLNASSNMLSSAAYNLFNVSMLSTTSAVSVTAGVGASAGQMTINSITQLATSASVKSTGVFTGTTMALDTKLSDLALSTPLTFDGGEISFSINGSDNTFTFSSDTTISTMMSTINSSAAGVKMSYSNLTKGFSITSNTTGSSSEIVIDNIKGNAFDATTAAFGITEGTVTGQDAMLNIEGIDVVKSSNSFTIDGITYSLKDESASAISFTVEKNISGTVDKIKAYVESYNKLLGTLQDKVGEDTYRTYTPLTDAQKDEMTEAEITKWEEKAKSGLLRNNSQVSTLINTLRSALYTAVEGAGMTMSSIGLTTGSYYDGGKITVDETKLRSALENNPDAVMNLFTKDSKSTDKATAFSESGLVVRISDAMLAYTSQATSETLVSLETQIDRSEDEVTTLLDRLSTKEKALYARFTAMETALSSLNSQSSWLSSMLGAS